MKPQALPGLPRPGFFQALRRWWGPNPLLQMGLFGGLIALLILLGLNMLATMRHLGLSPGFDFLGRAANFEIGEALIPFSASDVYARALLVGLLNTIAVSVLGCFLATILGLLLGVARLSGNLLLSGFVQGYIEAVRNVPLLLQLFLWSAITHALPPPRQALQPLDTVFLSNRGVFLPTLHLEAPSALWLIALAWVGVAGLYLLVRPRIPWGSSLRLAKPVVVLSILFLLLAFVLSEGAIAVEAPQLKGFNIVGGVSLSPEFAALLLGLTVHTSAGVAEIVRSGIESVSVGQWEAGKALGLSRSRILRLIVLPQAMRVITPLITSSYLDLTKNSSLAVAIGFPDLVSIVNTSANQTGQALETITILVGVYLVLNLTVSFVMNKHNARLAARGMLGK
ncbi:amino acid ABC transporter permease [Microvirga calopogonii]|uniref:amino acid ABC transporter permease n=1 Tax=Microvirga calopogonii TaxID=2078013 RepID=UPI000E0DF660|nr:ABC transporter permease subunit [Microvirga calopogonii]